MSLVLSIYTNYLLNCFAYFSKVIIFWNVNVSYSLLSLYLSVSLCLYGCMYVETESLFFKEKLG